MRQSTEINKSIQIKFYYFQRNLSTLFSRPEQRFIREILFGILSSTHVHASKIGRHIKDNLSLKKTLKRLSYHLSKPELWLRLQRAYLQTNESLLSHSSYFVLDIGDITKQYATKMEGLYHVHDGSHGGTKPGYWTIGVIGCEANPEKKNRLKIHPLYTELFSLHTEKEERTISENKKILNAISEVTNGCSANTKAFWVADRGLDRRKIIEPLLRQKMKFIIRLNTHRHLWYKCQGQSVDKIAGQVSLQHSYRIRRKHHNKYKWREYEMGAVAVGWINEFTKKVGPQKLWLVVAQPVNKPGSKHYFLVHADETISDIAQIIKKTAEGYSARWQIEEVYRHIKTQFHLESLAYRNYERIKNILAFIWLGLAFVYNQIIALAVDILACKSFKLNHIKFKFELLYNFIYYKLVSAVKLCLSKSEQSKIFSQYTLTKYESDQLIFTF